MRYVELTIIVPESALSDATTVGELRALGAIPYETLVDLDQVEADWEARWGVQHDEI